MPPASINPPLVIRPVDKTTQAQARTLILAGLGEHFGFIDETLNPDLDDILAHYSQKGDIFLVGLLDEQVVCTGALVQVTESVGQVVRMSVAKAHRRRGLARLMLQHLAKLAKERGYRKLLVQTNSDWHAAISLYKRFGFSVDKQDAVGIYMSLWL